MCPALRGEAVCTTAGALSERGYSLAFVLLLSVPACDINPFGEREVGREVQIELSIRGAVTSSGDGSPVPEATVKLGSGGHFTFPGIHETAVTDQEGYYEIQHHLTYREGTCPFMWMTAEAARYVPVHSTFSYHMSVTCTEQVQVIDIPLEGVSHGRGDDGSREDPVPVEASPQIDVRGSRAR